MPLKSKNMVLFWLLNAVLQFWYIYIYIDLLEVTRCVFLCENFNMGTENGQRERKKEMDGQLQLCLAAYHFLK